MRGNYIGSFTRSSTYLVLIRINSDEESAQSGKSSKLMIIRQSNSQGSLMISEEGLKTILNDLSPFDGFNKVLESFSPDGSGCYVNRFGTYLSPQFCPFRTSRRLESSLILKYVEENNRPFHDSSKQSGVSRWSVRHQGVYQSRICTHGKEDYMSILINPSYHLWNMIKDNYTTKAKLADDDDPWLTMITLAFASLTENWDAYITCLHRAVLEIRLDAKITDPHCSNIGEANTQSLKAALALMDRLQTATHVLEGNILTIQTIQQEMGGKLVRWSLQKLEGKDKLSDTAEAVIRDLEFRKRHVVLIIAKLESVTTMVRDLVNLRNTHIIERMTARSIFEAYTMRILALLTLCFLPPTFVAGFLDMDYVDVKSVNGMLKLNIEPGLWLYLAVTIPLLLVIIASYLVWDRRNVRKIVEKDSFV
ncbi:hypothetical protein CNYM01_03392 [Colletotrichum nymphaeae SA-01]|uniref:Uncharacterized protein n=1 Tax=Colletotrichum nymphaeae SA-01 TaxID=1460502 RepID=A0A135U3T7_9PEZI|nr:hypothetical protein CNYM01_03392 [Colletotrichum nymphaeae SA-01]